MTTVLLSLVCGEENPIIANPPPEYALPLRTLERLYVAMEWIGSHLRKNPSHASLDSSWEAAKVLLGIGTEPTDPIHVLCRPMAASSLGVSV